MTPARETASLPVPSFLAEDAAPVLIFGGKGGVGKTTSAAATAIATALAHPDESVMLVSTDPAHSVSDALNGMALPGNLRVCELDATAEHAEFMQRHGGALHEIAARGTFLDDSDISRFLDLSLPGVDELMNFVQLSKWFEAEEADRFIIDTAPTGHAFRLLAMPNMISGWMRAIDALLGKHRFMASVFGSGTEDEVDAFVTELQDAFDNIEAVWAEPDLTRFVPVFNAEPLSIAETERLLETLDELDISAPELVLNRLVPEESAGSLSSLRASQLDALTQLPPRISSRSVLALPLSSTEPRGEHLHSFFDSAITIPMGTPNDAGRLLPSVTGSIPVPGKVTLVAGKGGVGKTTHACAAAIALAERGIKTLLVSTDPAGNLGDAFETAVDDGPRTIRPLLEAMQLDADRELQSLKDEYADELDDFFDDLALDLSFDREALENLLELAPTGLDEVMALVRMTETLDSGTYDALVIDTAPTGHTLRLLELPALVQDWLNQIFSVLLKYEDLISLPRLNERLLSLSRGLKKLTPLLHGTEGTGVLVVTIPTRLGMAETRRLVAGCEKLGVPVNGLIVNQLTVAGDDSLSEAVSTRERAELADAQDMLDTFPHALVTRGSTLSGLKALSSVASDVYRAAEERRVAA